MFRTFGLVVLINLTLLGCSDLNVLTAPSSLSMRITKLAALSATPGEEITFYGVNLSNKLEVTLNGQPVAYELLSSSEGRMKIPLDNQSSVNRIEFSLKSKEIANFPIVNASSAEKIPLSEVDVSAICDDTIFKNAQGDLVRGERQCSLQGDATPSCTSDGETACLANQDFPAVDKAAKLLAQNIKTGVTIAGVTGVYPSTLAPLSNATSTQDLVSLDSTTAVGSYEFFDSFGNRYEGQIADLGSLVPSTSNQIFATANTVYRKIEIAGDADLSASNVKSGINLFGVAGSLTGAPANCTSESQSGCLVDGSTYGPALLSGLANKVIQGQSVANVSGNVTLPAVGNVLTGISFGIGGNALNGSLTLPLATNVRTGTGTYGDPGAAITPTYSPDFPSLANVKSSDTVDGVAGTLLDCSSDNGTGCVTTAAYPSVVASNVTAAKIKSGVVIAGVTGQYPSPTYPLAGSDSTADLDSATFQAKIKASTAFEWFDQNGARYTANGDTDLSSVTNVKNGVDIFGTTGTFGPDCSSDGAIGCVTTNTYKSANTAAYTAYDIRGGKTIGGVAGAIYYYMNAARLTDAGSYFFNRTSGTAANSSTTVADVYDTIQDDNFGYSLPPSNVPPGYVSAYSNWIRDSTSDSNSNGVCDGAEDCVYKDRFTNLYWLKAFSPSVTWETQITDCENSTLGGYTDWRLPTQKEAMTAYANGLWGVHSPLALTGNDTWTATTRAGSTTEAYVISNAHGTIGTAAKTNTKSGNCVRP